MLEKISEFFRPGLVIDFRLYWAALPLALLASVSTYAAGYEFLVSILYLVANLIAFSVVALVFVVSHRWMKPQGKFVLFPLIAFGLLLGFSKQIATAVIVVFMGLEDSILESIAIRALTPFIGLWTAIAIAAITSAQARFAKLREELIAERVRRLSASQASSSAELREFAEEAGELLEQSESMAAAELAGLIRDIVQQKLRPLSHELWDREQKRTPGFSSRELVRKALTAKPYRVFAISLLFALGSLQPVVVLTGEQWTLTLFWLTAPVMVSLPIANAIRKRYEPAKQNYVGALIVTSAVGGISGTLLLFLFGIEINPIMTLTSSWWLGTLILAVGTAAVAVEDYGEQRELLSQLAGGELDQEALSAVRTIRNRELANLLHSKTQNRMLAQAMRLESGSDLQSELSELRQLIQNLPKTTFDEPTTQELSDRWAGIILLRWDLDREPSPLQLRVIEEGISNAYRHGLANEIEISLRGDSLRISDNGLGPTSGNPGLGSSLFATAGQWTFKALPDGGGELLVRFSR